MESTIAMIALMGLGIAGLSVGARVYNGVWRSWAGSAWGRSCPHVALGALWMGAGFIVLAFGFVTAEVFASRRAAEAAYTACVWTGSAIVLASGVCALTRFPAFMVPAWMRGRAGA